MSTTGDCGERGDAEYLQTHVMNEAHRLEQETDSLIVFASGWERKGNHEKAHAIGVVLCGLAYFGWRLMSHLSLSWK